MTPKNETFCQANLVLTVTLINFKNYTFMPSEEKSNQKTAYTPQELKHFNDLLTEERDQTKQKIDEFEEAVGTLEKNPQDKSTKAAHHQGDIASEEDEREKFLIMLNKESKKLDEINDAIGRIKRGTFGICENTGKKISKERLEAIPYARYSIEAAK
jgi:RNA polymerase-binding protein DksA